MKAQRKTATERTPGPWALEVEDGGECIRIRSEEWGGIAILHDPLASEMGRTSTLEANARLIAAAPDLLGALSSIRSIAEAIGAGGNRTLDRISEIASAAIAKVESK
jgi:hypothetical protein